MGRGLPTARNNFSGRPIPCSVASEQQHAVGIEGLALSISAEHWAVGIGIYELGLSHYPVAVGTGVSLLYFERGL